MEKERKRSACVHGRLGERKAHVCMGDRSAWETGRERKAHGRLGEREKHMCAWETEAHWETGRERKAHVCMGDRSALGDWEREKSTCVHGRQKRIGRLGEREKHMCAWETEAHVCMQDSERQSEICSALLSRLCVVVMFHVQHFEPRTCATEGFSTSEMHLLL